MNEEFLKYLQEIGISTKIAIGRTEECLEGLRSICPEPIQDIFVTEVANAEGIRQYQSLWAFSEFFCLEAKSFLNSPQDNLDIVRSRPVRYLQLTRLDFDFKTATEKSRLTINFAVPSGNTCNLQASSNNCAHLWNITKKHVLPWINE